MKDKVITLSSDMYYDITDREYVSDLELPSKSHFKIYLSSDDKGYSINFETGIPSNESFFMFGGIYDPTDGLLYASVDRYKESIVVCDIIEYIDRKIRENAGFRNITFNLENLDTVTKLFKRFKVTGDEEALKSILTRKDNINSIIFKHIMGYTADKDLDPFSFDVIGLLKGDLVFYIYSVEKIFSKLMSRRLSKSNLSKEEKDVLKRSYAVFDDIDYTIGGSVIKDNGIVKNDNQNIKYDLRRMCTADYYLSGNVEKDGNNYDDDITAKNIVELVEYQSDEPVYSSDLDKLLKDNHFLPFLSDNDINYIKILW